MERRLATGVAAFFSVLVFSAAVLAQADTTKPTIIGFADMAARIESGYGPMLELELELRNKEPIYKASVIINGQSVSISFNALTGAEIRRQSPKRLDKDEARLYSRFFDTGTSAGSTPAKPVAALPFAAARISFQEASQIALTQVGGGTVKSIELDRKGGRMVYEVEIRRDGVKYEVYIDAAIGEVIRQKIDR